VGGSPRPNHRSRKAERIAGARGQRAVNTGAAPSRSDASLCDPIAVAGVRWSRVSCA